MMRVSPEDLIVVYKNSSTKEPAYKIRLYDIDTEDTKKTTHYAEVYSPTKVEIFKSVDDGSCATTGKGKARQFASYEFVEEKPHIYGRIPIITVYNNEEQMSDLEKIETLVNDYDKVLSDVSNEFEAFRNAYLMLKNMTASGDNIQKLKDEGIIEVMENGDVKFITKEIQSVEAAELTRNILIDWIPIFEDKQVEYDIDIPEQPVRVRLDMDSYMRIVNNLIQNVIAHSHADKIKIALSKKENNMELLLADNGVGIEKEDLKHIFERLYKCDKGRSEKGSGLGLSIVHQLVEKMGGSITVESLPGKGTEFMLLFPLES